MILKDNETGTICTDCTVTPNRAEATYAGPLYQIEEESWFDTVAENSPDHAGLVVEWVTLQQ
ncbi:MAG TPA: hypothetical protein VEO92_03955, partial [Candidatus Nitrosocosmicus sp.]|nr:hypothetical protein [Candidatus Nitrosocosmicus sp.]